jgi:uncharacterized OB-fold protein
VIPAAETESVATQTTPPPFREGLFQTDPLALIGSKCRLCGSISYPARPFCPRCRETEASDTVLLPPSGHIHTFTVIRQAPAGVDVPYVLARVELDDGTRLMAQVDTSDPEGVAIDDRVRLTRAVFRPQPGVELGGYAFSREEDQS